MNYFFQISIFFTLGVLSLFLQGFNFFKIGAINPNLILILFASLAVFYKRKMFFIVAAPVFALLIIWSLFFIPFWIWGIIIIGLLSGLASLLNLNITGNKFFDLLILVSSITVLFYIIISVLGFQSLNWFILGELVYNIFITFLFYFIVKKLKNI